MKLKITQAPYKHDYELEPKKRLGELAEEDYEKIKELMQEGKEREAREFVNDRLLNYELRHVAEFPEQAGMSTKTYAGKIAGKYIMEKNPEAAQALIGGDPNKGAELLLRSMHPNYKKHMQNAYKKAPLLTKLKMRIFGWNPSKIDPVDMTMTDGRIGGVFSPDKGIRMNPYKDPTSYANSFKHELDHALDFAAETLSEDEDFLKEYPKYKGFKKEDFPDKPESGYVNPIIPNLKDYDFKEGEFKSNYVRDPLDITEEITGKHRYGRKHLFEELMKKFK